MGYILGTKWNKIEINPIGYRMKKGLGWYREKWRVKKFQNNDRYVRTKNMICYNRLINVPEKVKN